MIIDPYQVLGIAPGASAEEIKHAYRNKAKECHPDLHPDDPKAHEKMQQVNEAYTLLTNPEKASGFQSGYRTRQGWNPYGGAAQQDSTDGWQQWTWQSWEPQTPRYTRGSAPQGMRPLRAVARFFIGMMLFRFLFSLLRVGLFGWWYW